MVANLEPVRWIRGRFGVRRIGRRFDKFGISTYSSIANRAIAICSKPALQAGPGPLQLRYLVNAVGRQPTTKKLSMDSMEPSMEPSSQSQNDKGFEWNQSMMWNKSNIKIGDAEYFHQFSARIGASQCWNFFRCKVGVDYKSAQDVYCLRCCKKLKSKPGEPIKYSF